MKKLILTLIAVFLVIGLSAQRTNKDVNIKAGKGLILNGTTSGSSNLDAPAVAGDVTNVMPLTGGNLLNDNGALDPDDYYLQEAAQAYSPVLYQNYQAEPLIIFVPMPTMGNMPMGHKRVLQHLFRVH